MQLPLRTFTSLVQDMAAGVQSASSQVLDLTVGSTLRAILESSASAGLWMQWLILQVLQMTRAATSSSTDLDSWMADFSLARLPSTLASGLVTFSRFNTSAPALVPLGTLVKTVDGSQSFAVTADFALGSFSQPSNGYILPAGVASLDLPVTASTPGSAGNVQAGSISVLASALAGVDTVSNAAAFQNGMDAESDQNFRLRFQSFLSSRSRATLGAIQFAIMGVQQGLNYAIQENQSAAGAPLPGNFLVYIDDGSGYPSNQLLTHVYQAIDAVRPVGSTFAVFPPAVISASVSLTVSAPNKPAVAPKIVNALSGFINALPLGAPLPLTRVAQIAYDSDLSIANVTNILVNGSAQDVVVPASGVIKAGAILVN
jgi:uncharacterized phage protein gp47/JayE